METSEQMHSNSELIQDLRKLIEKCEYIEIDAFKDQIECWFKYSKDEIEIRIESLKIEVDALGDVFHRKINKIEHDLKNMSLRPYSISRMHKLEKLFKKLRDGPCQTITSEYIGSLYKPTCATILQAVRIGNCDDLEHYLSQSIQEVNLEELLLEACEHDQRDIAKILLWKNANVNAIAADGSTPILKASRRGLGKIVMHLVYNHANINTMNVYGKTALLEASSKGHVDIVKFLIENNANVKQRDLYGETALTMASLNGHVNTVMVLLEKNSEEMNDSLNDEKLIANMSRKTTLMCAMGSYISCLKDFMGNNNQDEDEQTCYIAPW